MRNATLIERKLRESLAKDRSKPSRCHQNADGTTVVNISGTSCGLVLALHWETGEDEDAILARMGKEQNVSTDEETQVAHIIESDGKWVDCSCGWFHGAVNNEQARSQARRHLEEVRTGQEGR